ncbi:hypothetical protein PPYR_11149 [Photinus pyralis]|uniref:Uncharacterized protein n=1 Tax=Photinus pyralis TaxID=7054 RepID=A0A1Y1KBT0_PHOPY|nr:uncharacterized protein PFB0145c-like [Photinus pyralis]KAB0794310.1 hypothetical protein PPYR_11149 [Photinus pyralis]
MNVMDTSGEAINSLVSCKLKLIELLTEQLNLHKQQNFKLKEALEKLQILDNEFNLLARNELDKLVDVQNKFETKDCNCESISLSHADRLRKQTNYTTKVKSSIKMYNNLIAKLTKDIKFSKSELERSKNQIAGITRVSSDEVKIMQAKIDRYEKEILKFEKKYPWLSDQQYGLPNISKQTETLNNLRREKARLMQELERYHSLKPDINEAMQQLAAIKQEYDGIM